MRPYSVRNNIEITIVLARIFSHGSSRLMAILLSYTLYHSHDLSKFVTPDNISINRCCYD